MHIIRGEVFSLVFEPIVDMLNSVVVGYEGLCRCKNLDINAETFFKSLSVREHLDLLSLQLQKYQKWVEQHPEFYQGRALFLNVNQELLFEADFPTLFVPYHRYYPINLELEPQDSLTYAHCLEIKKIVDTYGIPLWFDDYAGGKFSTSNELWSGIKLDKYFFWSLAGNIKEKPILNSSLLAGNLICEGVETITEKNVALALGLRYGQGYLWPAVG